MHHLRLELCFQYFKYRTLLHCFQYKVVVHVVRLYNMLCYNKVTVLFIRNVCGKRYHLNLFSSVFCATFLQSFLLYPYSISTPPSSFSFPDPTIHGGRAVHVLLTVPVPFHRFWRVQKVKLNVYSLNGRT